MRHRAVKIRNYLKAKQHFVNKTQAYNFRDNEGNKKGNKTRMWIDIHVKRKGIVVQHKIFKTKQWSENEAIKKSQASINKQKNIVVLLSSFLLKFERTRSISRDFNLALSVSRKFLHVNNWIFAKFSTYLNLDAQTLCYHP